ncbi:hypothetical protein N781_14790 [Pontibacillus halophilus JSM 076056 = DSM 19796]|uniref:Uncharacterized protein n=1 Tax=Pontibacillus halophilus JSM 076056 = DSM 19796 TaxID=1385510 RepID=A0A0A5GN68_9BACI|nr:YuzL family protein [Pontibacillus halophilus]KGX92595.1 hypothetical protein N781_14790 [Pontibacillus halophilus JSM 076056 = DSM 19796]
MPKQKKNPSQRGKSAASVKGPTNGPVDKFRDEPENQTNNMQYKKHNTAGE